MALPNVLARNNVYPEFILQRQLTRYVFAPLARHPMTLSQRHITGNQLIVATSTNSDYLHHFMYDRDHPRVTGGIGPIYISFCWQTTIWALRTSTSV